MFEEGRSTSSTMCTIKNYKIKTNKFLSSITLWVAKCIGCFIVCFVLSIIFQWFIREGFNWDSNMIFSAIGCLILASSIKFE